MDFNPYGGGRARYKIGFQVNVQEESALDSGVGTSKKVPYFETKFESCQDGRKSSACSSGSSSDSKVKGCHGGQCSLMCCSLLLHLQHLLDQCKSPTSNKFTLNMVKGNYLQIRCHSLLSHNFRQFKIKTTLSHPLLS